MQPIGRLNQDDCGEQSAFSSCNTFQFALFRMTRITPYIDVILISNDWQPIQASFINCLYLTSRKTQFLSSEKS